MTIALGILASDGVVIAADSQLTIQGYWKGAQGKIGAIERLMLPGGFQGACLVSGSTNDFPYLAALGDEILQEYQAQVKTHLSVSFDSHLRMLVKRFHDMHLASPGGVELEMIVGSSRGGRDELWSSRRSVVNGHHECVAVGIGAATATTLLGRLWQRSAYDATAAVGLAAFVALLVKESVDGCGKHTDIFVAQQGAYWRVPKALVTKLEEAFSQYLNDQEPRLARILLGAASGEEAASIDAVGVAIARSKSDVAAILDKVRAGIPGARVKRAPSQPAPQVLPSPTRGRRARPPSQA